MTVKFSQASQAEEEKQESLKAMRGIMFGVIFGLTTWVGIISGAILVLNLF